MSQISETDRDSMRFAPSKSGRQKTMNQQELTVDPEFVSLTDSVSISVTNLEKRLTTCSGIYDLARNASDIRERERNANNQLISQSLKQLDDRIAHIEETIPHINIFFFITSNLFKRSLAVL